MQPRSRAPVVRLVIVAAILGAVGFGLQSPLERAAFRLGWTPLELALAVLLLAAGSLAALLLLLRGAHGRRWIHGATLGELDRMTGDAFERWIHRALASSGFAVEATPRTRDFGVDLVAVAGEVRIGVEAKRQAGPVPSPVVRSVVSGCHFHGCDVAAVVTTSRFTADARRQAAGSGMTVVLVDRDRLASLARHLHEAARRGSPRGRAGRR